MARMSARRLNIVAPIGAVALALTIAGLWALNTQPTPKPAGEQAARAAISAENVASVDAQTPPEPASTSTTMPAPAKALEPGEAERWHNCLPPITELAAFAAEASAECLATYRAEVRRLENENRQIWLSYCVEVDGSEICADVTALPPLSRKKLCGSTELTECRKYYERPVDTGANGAPIRCTEGRIAPIDPCANTVEYLAALKKAADNG